MSKYKLDAKRDIDLNEDGFFLYLPYGWRFDNEVVHCRNFETMTELREAVRNDVIKCDCAECKRELAAKKTSAAD
jgi:hypothetical protein